jgi:hypothetical protein
MIKPTRKTIICRKCGNVFNETFFEGNKYEIHCHCGNIIKGDI